MQSNFFDAHRRHWQDAELLFRAERWANADHLYGMAGECGLKQLMLAFGMPFDDDRDRPQQGSDRKHIEGIWVRYETYRNGHYQGAGYALPGNNPFADWHVAQRYASQSSFSFASVEPHRQGASKIHQLVRKARRDGLL